MSSSGKSSQSDAIGNSLKQAFQDTVDQGVPEQFRKLIDANLKRAYDETVSEGVPDRFRDLMEKLRARTGDTQED